MKICFFLVDVKPGEVIVVFIIMNKRCTQVYYGITGDVNYKAVKQQGHTSHKHA
jgi:hypothetical protein